MLSSRTMGASHLLCTFIGAVLLWKSPGCSAASRVNLALSGTAVQSSTIGDRNAQRAIDGITDSQAHRHPCSNTKFEKNGWWRLELPGVFRVSEIEVTDSMADPGNLDGVEILIGNSLVNNGNDNPRCAIHHPKETICFTQTVKCWGMEGRFINFYNPPDVMDPMILCEVKVYGDLAPPSISLTAIERNITLVGLRLCWSDALAYCREHHWDLLSLMGPEDQEMMDELVARAPFPLTSHLWMGLRRSNLGSPWFWMSGDPMVAQWEQGTQHSSPCAGVSSMKPSTWRHRSCEEHLNFICFTGPTKGVNKVYFYSSARENQIRCS